MENWFYKVQSVANPKIRLFCFPYAGGSAQVFNDWKNRLPDYVEVNVLQAPGRGVRFSEEPIACLDTIVEKIANAMRERLDRPVVIYGHSNGALMGFEVARYIQKYFNSSIAHLILSAKKPNKEIGAEEPIHHLPYDEFIGRLQTLKATPQEVLQNRELMEMYIPMLRADFALSEHPLKNQHEKLRVPCSLFYGEEDEGVGLKEILEWKQWSSKNVFVKGFKGGHFFLNECRDEVINEIISILDVLARTFKSFKVTGL